MPSAWQIVLQSLLFVTLAVAGTYLIGLDQSPTAFLFLVGLPSIPFLLKIFQCEVEVEERKQFLGSRTLARHYTAIKTLAAFFIGLVLAFAFFYLALPQQDSAQLFSTQKSELGNIRGSFQGHAIAEDVFEKLFSHNLQVLMFIILFSLVYGAGAVFILVWNASVIGVFLGEFSTSYIVTRGAEAGGHLTGVSLGLLGILPHGTLELGAYLIAALAGGILSAAIIRGDYKEKEFPLIIYDVAKLVAWAIVFLAVGAFIEANPALLG